MYDDLVAWPGRPAEDQHWPALKIYDLRLHHVRASMIDVCFTRTTCLKTKKLRDALDARWVDGSVWERPSPSLFCFINRYFRQGGCAAAGPGGGLRSTFPKTRKNCLAGSPGRGECDCGGPTRRLGRSARLQHQTVTYGGTRYLLFSPSYRNMLCRLCPPCQPALPTLPAVLTCGASVLRAGCDATLPRQLQPAVSSLRVQGGT